MEYVEYPKSLYKGGRSGEHVIVADADAEKAAREDGFASLAELEAPEAPEPEQPKKKGKKE